MWRRFNFFHYYLFCFSIDYHSLLSIVYRVCLLNYTCLIIGSVSFQFGRWLNFQRQLWVLINFLCTFQYFLLMAHPTFIYCVGCWLNSNCFFFFFENLNVGGYFINLNPKLIIVSILDPKHCQLYQFIPWTYTNVSNSNPQLCTRAHL